MNILVTVGRFFLDAPGGSGKVAWDSCKFLASQGHDVTLAVYAIHRNQPAVESVEGVRIIRYQLADWFNRLTRHQKGIIQVLERELRGERIDLVWGFNPLQYLGAIQAFPHAARAYAVCSPFAMEEMTHANGIVPWIKSQIAKFYERHILRVSSSLIAHSQFTKRALKELYGEELSSKVVVSPGWAEASKLSIVQDASEYKRKLGWSGEQPVLFTLRRLVARMGLDTLVDAAAILRSRGRDFKLYIGGQGPMKQHLEDQISHHGLSDQVKLLGRLDDATLAMCYAACDLFVLPTRSLECFGLIAAEAMACGKPVVSTPCGSLPEVVGGFEPQWMTVDYSAESLADKIDDFLLGRLPMHSPAEIRQHFEKHYSDARALPAFCERALEAVAPPR